MCGISVHLEAKTFGYPRARVRHGDKSTGLGAAKPIWVVWMTNMLFNHSTLHSSLIDDNLKINFEFPHITAQYKEMCQRFIKYPVE